MPPAAATECERTGWTLLMIATLAPCCAAARAARCPARPAAMIKTSCAGMAPCASSWGETAARLYNERASVPGSSGGRQGAADLGEGDHALQHPVGVDGDHRAEPAEALRAEHRFERRLFADPHGQVLLEGVHHLESRAPGGDLRLDALLAHHAEEVARRVDDHEPRPVVAQDELLLGVQQRHVGWRRDGLAIHDVGDADVVDTTPQRALDDGDGGR